MFNNIVKFLFLMSLVTAQSQLSDLNRLSNSQLDKLKDELTSSSLNENDNSSNVEKQDALESVEIISSSISSDKKIKDFYFGYEYFYNDINFYDNIPTPLDFKLGPGDEVIISLWGQTNSREKFVINKEGLIYYSNIGFINLSNRTLKEAENLLKNELSKIYSSINDSENQTNLMLELGQLKSINVFLTGQVNKPGIHLIHPFSDAFTSIVQAGGIKNSGSLRNIQIIRSNQVLATIDFYDFFSNGTNNFSSIRILDGDIIHVPTVEIRNEILGEVVNPGFYELLPSNTVSNLIDYAGGFSALTSSKAIIYDIKSFDERSSDDNAKLGRIIDLKMSMNESMNNGASIKLLSIANNDVNVAVFGRVNFPGDYPFFDGVTLKFILDSAGGFDDPIFRKTINEQISILRLDENQFYGKEISINYNESDNFLLEMNDKIFVYENVNYQNSFTYTIKGEVNKPGTYPLKDGLTLNQAVKNAGGITEIGSINSLSVSKPLLRLDEEGNQIEDTELVGNIDLGFEITDNNVITVLPKTNVIRVDGNVYNPGLIAHQTGRGMSLSNAIELAGGYKPYSLKSRAYVIRANGQIERVNIFRGRAKRVFPGDSIFVPVDPNPDEFDITSFIADLSSTLANIAAILLIADNNN